ncbi:hypothetical protein [Zavarzinia compransoris]|uniref:DUF1488 domain-containing protein n=1 Tax=Zavarzinia compransoris TaxID=1264899 RepID=A0A317E170_9PROT|nr:hypothetical protein [Zavarzinia compransoris]PWR19866.1 hypothetical protein DKG75_15535 [Zavarzinia compransoris]TDP45023.1 hypothetical protein DES42_106245 [Zavarzinia compransoris]
MSALDWGFRIDDAFHAQFLIDDEEPRPGVEFVVGLSRGALDLNVLVRCMFADDVSPATLADHRYQAQTAIGFLADQLVEGWSPEGGEEFTIVIADPADSH